MHVKSIVSALALSAALALTGSAFAQTMFNGVELAEGDVAAVTERCEQLTTAAGATLTDSTENAPATGATSSDTDANAGAADATLENVEPVNEMEAATTTIDLDTVTLEQCTAAGLPAPAM